MDELTAAYKFILKNPDGDTEDFTTKINAEVFEEFSKIGYIKRGVNSKFTERYEITPFGKKQIETFLETEHTTNELSLLCDLFGV